MIYLLTCISIANALSFKSSDLNWILSTLRIQVEAGYTCTLESHLPKSDCTSTYNKCREKKLINREMCDRNYESCVNKARKK